MFHLDEAGLKGLGILDTWNVILLAGILRWFDFIGEAPFNRLLLLGFSIRP